MVASELVDADRPEAHVNLGLLNIQRQRPQDALAAYRTALRLDPRFVPALANLADLYRMQGLDDEGASLLRRAIAIEPGNAEVRHALGLLLVRQRKYPEALAELRQASTLAPDDTRYSYVYAIALHSTGASAEARDLLERTHRQHPSDQDVLVGLTTIAQDQGDLAGALVYARKLLILLPTNQQIRATVQDLERRQPH